MVHRRETLFVTGHPQTTGFRHMTCGGGLDSELLCLRPSEKVHGEASSDGSDGSATPRTRTRTRTRTRRVIVHVYVYRFAVYVYVSGLELEPVRKGPWRS